MDDVTYAHSSCHKDAVDGLIDAVVKENWTTIEAIGERRIISAVSPININSKNKVNIVALGDVGMNVAIGLTLMGGSVISRLGLYDINHNNVRRCYFELSQFFGLDNWQRPQIDIISEAELFDCDILVFCASSGVPSVNAGAKVEDVRMAQLAKNKLLVEKYGQMAADAKFKGLVAMVSDPVDPLAYVMLKSGKLEPWQVKGYGLGVMNARARYYAEQNYELATYLKDGRVYGPHGKDLVVVNSMGAEFSKKTSLKLQSLVSNANLEVRQLGYKPFIAPAVSSAVMAIINTLEGKTHYSSVYLGDIEKGAFLGMQNRLSAKYIEVDNSKLPYDVLQWISTSWNNLIKLNVSM